VLLPLVGVALSGSACTSDSLAPVAAAVVRLAVSPTEAISGDTVQVVVSLANPTGRPLRFQPARSVCYLEFEVRDSTGVRVGPTGWGCIAIVPGPVELAPHGDRRIGFTWRVRTCAAAPTGGAICVDAAPGRYALRGLADLGGPEPRPSPVVMLQVRAP
jgi:hypothetical protein